MELKDLELKMTYKRIGSRPDGLMTDLPNHFRVHLHRNGAYRRFYFSMGEAYTGEPELFDVLESLISEYWDSFYSFSEFCYELGYDGEEKEDRRKAETVYRLCLENAKKIDALFPDIEMSELQHLVEHTNKGVA